MTTQYQIARIAHEMNKRWCELIGDNSQPAWEDAPEWQRESAINGVKYHADNPDSRPEHSHTCWLEGKILNGWKYGPVKDAEKKEHPCIVPYEDLPAIERAKDTFFLTIVRALLEDK